VKQLYYACVNIVLVWCSIHYCTSLPLQQYSYNIKLYNLIVLLHIMRLYRQVGGATQPPTGHVYTCIKQCKHSALPLALQKKMVQVLNKIKT